MHVTHVGWFIELAGVFGFRDGCVFLLCFFEGMDTRAVEAVPSSLVRPVAVTAASFFSTHPVGHSVMHTKPSAASIQQTPLLHVALLSRHHSCQCRQGHGAEERDARQAYRRPCGTIWCMARFSPRNAPTSSTRTGSSSTAPTRVGGATLILSVLTLVLLYIHSLQGTLLTKLLKPSREL